MQEESPDSVALSVDRCQSLRLLWHQSVVPAQAFSQKNLARTAFARIFQGEATARRGQGPKIMQFPR